MHKTKSAKLFVSQKITVDAYRVVVEAVESGILYGWNRAHKHVSKPSEDMIIDEINKGVMLELCEWLSFSEDDAS